MREQCDCMGCGPCAMPPLQCDKEAEVTVKLADGSIKRMCSPCANTHAKQRGATLCHEEAADA